MQPRYVRLSFRIYSTGGGGNYFALSNPKITRLPQLQLGPHYAALQKRGRNTRPIETKRESRDGRKDNISTAGVDLTCLGGECLCGAAELAACHVLPCHSNLTTSRLLLNLVAFPPAVGQLAAETPDSTLSASHGRMHLPHLEKAHSNMQHIFCPRSGSARAGPLPEEPVYVRLFKEDL